MPSIYGITLFQLYRYYSKFNRRDRLALKFFVCATFILHSPSSRFADCCTDVCRAVTLLLRSTDAYARVTDTFHLALVCHFFYYYTVSHFGDFVALSVATW